MSRLRAPVIGFYTDERGRSRPLTGKSAAQTKQILLHPQTPRLPKPSWKQRPIYTMKNGMVHLGIYDKDVGVMDSVPLEAYKDGGLNKGYQNDRKRPTLVGVAEWSSPDLTPSKLAQRRDIANKINGGTVLELCAGRGHLSKEVWAKKADNLVLVDKQADYLVEAHDKLKGKVKHETIAVDNGYYIRNMLTPQTLKVVDVDAFGSPAKPLRLLFENMPVKKPMYVCLTDGSNIFIAFHKHEPEAGRKYYRDNYGVDIIPEGRREDQIKALDGMMKGLAQKHGFKVEPVNMAFGRKQSVYAAYKVSPR